MSPHWLRKFRDQICLTIITIITSEFPLWRDTFPDVSTCNSIDRLLGFCYLCVNIPRGELMDSSRNAPIKIAIFAVVALVFVGLLIIYTEARQDGKRTDYVGRMTNDEAFGHNHDGRKHFEKSFIVELGGDLMLDTDFGDVEVSGWEKAEVEVSTDVE